MDNQWLAKCAKASQRFLGHDQQSKESSFKDASSDSSGEGIGKKIPIKKCR